MSKRLIFRVATPLGYHVRLTRDRWREILRFKHPALQGREGEVEQCLRDPDTVRSSLKEAAVHVYYRLSPKGYVCVVVSGDDNEDRFVITAYYARKIKKGDELWTK
jgi:hypothetical protein